jgi:hypothetical protein
MTNLRRFWLFMRHALDRGDGVLDVTAPIAEADRARAALRLDREDGDEARFRVRAVDAHDALVLALHDAWAEAHAGHDHEAGYTCIFACLDPLCVRVREAMALAEGTR